MIPLLLEEQPLLQTKKCPNCSRNISPEKLSDHYFYCIQDGINNHIFKRYKCPKCNKYYKSKKNLDGHLKEDCIDVFPKYECDICFSRFRRKYHVSRHKRTTHGIDNNENTQQ